MYDEDMDDLPRDPEFELEPRCECGKPGFINHNGLILCPSCDRLYQVIEISERDLVCVIPKCFRSKPILNYDGLLMCQHHGRMYMAQEKAWAQHRERAS